MRCIYYDGEYCNTVPIPRYHGPYQPPMIRPEQRYQPDKDAKTSYCETGQFMECPRFKGIIQATFGYPRKF
jgi:hypothetical protein